MATPLYKKLGLKEGMKVYTTWEEPRYRNLFEHIPEQLSWKIRPNRRSIHFAHCFCTDHSMLEATFSKLIKAISYDGMLWISWPKGSSKIDSEINREDVRNAGLKAGLVDVKVASVDSNWSALKFVYRLKDRKAG